MIYIPEKEEVPSFPLGYKMLLASPMKYWT